MSTNIKIGIPQYINANLVISITGLLKNGTRQTGTITASFEEFLPWSNLVSEEAIDFYLISIFTYGIDRFIPRRANSVDGWTRDIKIDFPVYQVGKWQDCKNNLEKLLSFLTGDNWIITFYKNKLALPVAELAPTYQKNFEVVSLFSGGLDSLIGAIDILENSQKQSLFVSHYDQLMHGPKKDQIELKSELIKKYAQRFTHLPSIKVYLSQTSLIERETTSRSRSLLFIGMALILSEAKKTNIIVPENGTVSLNYPLSPSRRSSCSTRTTHPTFLNLVELLFLSLGINSKIRNPYKFKTKQEMVNSCSNKKFLQKILHLSNSCGKRGHRAHWDNSGTHCGICMPCIYRRSALGKNDDTGYGNNITSLNHTLLFRKKWQDVSSMLTFLHEEQPRNQLKFELISNGLQDQENLYNYVDLVIRTKEQLSDWIKLKGNSFVKRAIKKYD